MGDDLAVTSWIVATLLAGSCVGCGQSRAAEQAAHAETTAGSGGGVAGEVAGSIAAGVDAGAAVTTDATVHDGAGAAPIVDASTPLGDLEPVPPAPADRPLPDAVWLKDTVESYNRAHYFAVKDGAVFVRPNLEQAGTTGSWQELTLPPELAGDATALSADDNEIVVLDSQRQIWTMTGALGAPSGFSWKKNWGPPLWTGPGFQVMPDLREWVWTVISRQEDDHFIDPAGNPQLVGLAKVSHIWQLAGTGYDVTYIDPWLPNDYSYQLCTPERGRFEAMSISGSGSTTFVINRFGDMFTRLYDFDISGADTVFFAYSYEDQTGNKLNPPIQLPAPGWIEHPKIAGRITDRIGLHKVGRGAVHRVMRVEGLDPDGNAGFFEKDLTDMDGARWTFHRTDQPLKGRFFLDNRPEDLSAEHLGPGEDLRFALNAQDPAAPGGGQSFGAELLDFNVYCSPSTLRIHTSATEHFDLVLHNVDGLRQQGTRAPGLDATPRAQDGMIEVPDELLRAAGAGAQAFIDGQLGGRKFTAAPISASADRIELTVGLARWSFAAVR